MAQVFVFGHVTADLTLKKSQSDNPYLCFDLAENIGYGKNQRTSFYQVWAWGTDALRLVRFSVKKNSFLWITGSLELVDCTDKSGETKTKRLKVALDNWGFVPSGPPSQSNHAETSAPVMKELDGDRSPLPE